MATIIPTNFQIVDDKSGNHFVICQIVYDPTLTTTVINVPKGLVSAAVLTATTTATAAGVTVSQTNQTVTLDNAGTAGTIYVVSWHVGSAGGCGADS